MRMVRYQQNCLLRVGKGEGKARRGEISRRAGERRADERARGRAGERARAHHHRVDQIDADVGDIANWAVLVANHLDEAVLVARTLLAAAGAEEERVDEGEPPSCAAVAGSQIDREIQQ